MIDLVLRLGPSEQYMFIEFRIFLYCSWQSSQAI